MKAVFKLSRQSPGSRRMAKNLRTEGFEMGCYRVSPLMDRLAAQLFVGNQECGAALHHPHCPIQLGVLLRTLFGFGTLKGLG